MRQNIKMYPKKTPISQLLTKAIKKSKKKHREIAKEVGYKSPNNIAMIASGYSKVSFEKIPALSKSLNICEIRFMMLAFKVYKPKVYQWMQLNMVPISPQERKAIKEVAQLINNRI